MGEGGIKNGQKNSDVFYGRPLLAMTTNTGTHKDQHLTNTYNKTRTSYGHPMKAQIKNILNVWV